jgi:hypothetical protein
MSTATVRIRRTQAIRAIIRDDDIRAALTLVSCKMSLNLGLDSHAR